MKNKLTAFWQPEQVGTRPISPGIEAFGGQSDVCNRLPAAYHWKMPTVLRSGPYRFFFYAGDQGEPPHVHVERDDREAKYWLDPLRLQSSFGFAANELRRIEKLVNENQQLLLDKWNEFFHR